MIISVADARNFITTDLSDTVLEVKLQALEGLIRKYTNNNFQKRNARSAAELSGSLIACDTTFFSKGDTVQITDSKLNDGLYVVTDIIDGAALVVAEDLFSEDNALVTKIAYPADVVVGVLNMLKWDIESRDKIGIQSETISRHSVTYFNMDGDNSTMGYPKSLLGFLRPYMKARFGQGLRV